MKPYFESTTMRPRSAAVAARVAAALLVLAAGAAQAQTLIDTRPMRFFLGGGLTGGGDRLVTAQFTDGRDYTLRGGGLVQIHAGLEFRVAPEATVALSLGYHVDSADAIDGSTWFRRVPIEALAHVRVHPQWRIGGGLRVATNPRLSSDGRAPLLDEDFRTAIGAVVEIEHLFNHWFGLKLRGVTERYKSKAGLPTVSGDHIGLMVNFYF